MRIGCKRAFEKPEMTYIPEGEGIRLKALQGLVGGYIEMFDPLWGDEPCLVVNEEGVYLPECRPNLLVRANKRMVDVGYLSQRDFSRVVVENEPYAVLFGTVLAVSYDKDGEPRDITAEEFERFAEMCSEADLTGVSREELLAML